MFGIDEIQAKLDEDDSLFLDSYDTTSELFKRQSADSLITTDIDLIDQFLFKTVETKINVQQSVDTTTNTNSTESTKTAKAKLKLVSENAEYGILDHCK